MTELNYVMLAINLVLFAAVMQNLHEAEQNNARSKRLLELAEDHLRGASGEQREVKP